MRLFTLLEKGLLLRATIAHNLLPASPRAIGRFLDHNDLAQTGQRTPSCQPLAEGNGLGRWRTTDAVTCLEEPDWLKIQHMAGGNPFGSRGLGTNSLGFAFIGNQATVSSVHNPAFRPRLRAAGRAVASTGSSRPFSVQIVITLSARAASRKSLDLRALSGLTSPCNASSPFFRELRERPLQEGQVR